MQDHNSEVSTWAVMEAAHTDDGFARQASYSDGAVEAHDVVVVDLVAVVDHEAYHWSLDSHDVLHGPWSAPVSVAALRPARVRTDTRRDGQMS